MSRFGSQSVCHLVEKKGLRLHSAFVCLFSAVGWLVPNKLCHCDDFLHSSTYLAGVKCMAVYPNSHNSNSLGRVDSQCQVFMLLSIS